MSLMPCRSVEPDCADVVIRGDERDSPATVFGSLISHPSKERRADALPLPQRVERDQFALLTVVDSKGREPPEFATFDGHERGEAVEGIVHSAAGYDRSSKPHDSTSCRSTHPPLAQAWSADQDVGTLRHRRRKVSARDGP